MGFSEQQILRAFAEVSETSPSREMSAIWPTVLCRLREDEVYGLILSLKTLPTNDHCDMHKPHIIWTLWLLLFFFSFISIQKEKVVAIY